MEEQTNFDNIIYDIRGMKVMLDSDLARLYEIDTGRLNEAVKRNSERFPDDFMFQLTDEEWESLISQIAISKTGRGGRRKHPYVFTEQGVAMLSSVLNSKQAILVNVRIMRAFVAMRRAIIAPENLSEQVAELRKTMLLYMDKNDKRVDSIIRVLDQLISTPDTQKKAIGFRVND
jgi:hypothetical protein